MAVKLYILDELRNVQGLFADKALAKMNGDLEVYSTLLDKFLNQAPRTIPRLKQLLKPEKMTEYAEELKNLRMDLADIFAMDLLGRANVLYDAAEKGEFEKCKQQLEPFIHSLQDFSYEVKQCRTQDDLENSEEAANKAAELDIGSSMVNNKYATVNKGKFIDLFNRINNGLFDKALNLANVLKAMGYDAELSVSLERIVTSLNNNKAREALNECTKLLVLLNCAVPEINEINFMLLLVNASSLYEQIKNFTEGEYDLTPVITTADAIACVKSTRPPDFILLNSSAPGPDTYAIAAQLKKTGSKIPLGFIFNAPTSQDILKARQLGSTEFFILPLDKRVFLERLSKYKHQ